VRFRAAWLLGPVPDDAAREKLFGASSGPGALTDQEPEGTARTPRDGGNDEWDGQRQEGTWRREAHGCSRGKRSEERNPMDATGTKQGRKGPRRSARRATVENRTRRLPGGGNSRMTCCLVPRASKGKRPHGRCQMASAMWQSSPVTLRSGDKAMRGWARVFADPSPGPDREHLEVRPRKGQGHGGCTQPIRYYRSDYQDSAGHSNHKGEGFFDGDVALAAGERLNTPERKTNST